MNYRVVVQTFNRKFPELDNMRYFPGERVICSIINPDCCEVLVNVLQRIDVYLFPVCVNISHKQRDCWSIMSMNKMVHQRVYFFIEEDIVKLSIHAA